MTDQELSGGVVAYLQRGSAASPRADDSAVLAVAVATPPHDLLATVQGVVNESVDVPVNWDGISLGDAGRLVASEMAARHPELTPEALDALAWNFTYAWR